MSEDLTKKLPTSDSDKLALILRTVQPIETRLAVLEQKIEEADYRDIYDVRGLETNCNPPNSST